MNTRTPLAIHLRRVLAIATMALVLQVGLYSATCVLYAFSPKVAVSSGLWRLEDQSVLKAIRSRVLFYSRMAFDVDRRPLYPDLPDASSSMRSAVRIAEPIPQIKSAAVHDTKIVHWIGLWGPSLATVETYSAASLSYVVSEHTAMVIPGFQRSHIPLIPTYLLGVDWITCAVACCMGLFVRRRIRASIRR